MASTPYADLGDLNDVVSGSNGTCVTLYLCTATTGYDGPTGLGTPSGVRPFLYGGLLPPSAPIGLTAVYGHSVDLAWTAPAGAAVAGYVIERGGAQIARTSAATSYADTNVSPGVTYTYDVRSVDAAGNLSPPSNPATATVPASSDTTSPSTPSSLKAPVVGTTQVALAWVPSTDNAGVDHYNVYRDGAVVGTATLPNYLDAGLSPATSHVYKVVAVDAAGNSSSASSSATAKTASATSSSTGTLTGVVYNLAGRPLVNAVVQLARNGVTKSAKTNGSGVYKFTSLAPGDYTVTAGTTAAAAASAAPSATSVVGGVTTVVVSAG